MDQMLEEEQEALRNICPRCNSIIYGNYCTRCKRPVPTEKYYDPDFDEYMADVEKENEDFFRDVKDESKWKEVTDETGIGDN